MKNLLLNKPIKTNLKTRTLLSALSLLAVSTPGISAPDLSNFSLVFSDEFDQPTLDATRWQSADYWGPFVIVDNQEQFYIDELGINASSMLVNGGNTPSPFDLNGSTLKINATPIDAVNQIPATPDSDAPIWLNFPNYRSFATADGEPYFDPSSISYLSGLLSSQNAFSFTHGYIEARVRLPAGQGLHPSISLKSRYLVERAPTLSLVDFAGGNTTALNQGYRYFDPDSDYTEIVVPPIVSSDTNYSSDWQTVGLAWDPKEIVWYVNDNIAGRLGADEHPLPNQAMHLVINLAVDGSGGSSTAATGSAAVFEIDYIRTYQRDIRDTLTQSVLDDEYHLMFEDDFSGNSLDTSRWNTHNLWGPYWQVNDEQQFYPDIAGAHSEQDYSVAPVATENGYLLLQAAPVAPSDLPSPPAASADEFLQHPSWRYSQAFNNPQYLNPPPGESGHDPDGTDEPFIPGFTSGVVTSYESFSFTHGYAEIRARMPQVEGLWPSFWLHNSYFVGREPAITVAEITAGNRLDHAYRGRNEDGSLVVNERSTPGEYGDAFHTYGIAWEPGKLSWYVDGQLLHTYSGSDIPVQSMYAVINLAVASEAVATVDSNLLPAAMEVDHVRIYQHKSVPQQVEEPPPTDPAISIEPDTSFTVSQPDRDVWTHIDFDEIFQEPPIVIPSLLSSNDGDPAEIMLSDISGSGVDVRIGEWEYLDGEHADERIGLFMLPPGNHDLGGLTAVAGRATATRSYRRVDFATPFSSPPIILAHLLSDRDDIVATVRLRNIDANGFSVRLQTEQAIAAGGDTRDLFYVAIEEGVGSYQGRLLQAGRTGRQVDHRPYTIDFDQAFENPVFYAQDQQSYGRDTSLVRLLNLTDMRAEIFIEEEQSGDTEVRHTREDVGWLVTGSGPVVLPGINVSSHESFIVSQPDENEWTRVNFTDNRSEPPVLIPSLLTTNDDEPAEIMIADLDVSGVDIQTGEWEYLDGAHGDEDLALFMLQPGQHDIGGLTALAGKAAVSGDYQRVEFDSAFLSTPVVLAHLVSQKSDRVATIRLRDIDETGFRVRLQTEEALGTAGELREFHYIAIEAGIGSHAGRTLIANTTGRQVTHNNYTIDFGQALSDTVLYAQDQQTYGGDTSLIRLRELEADSALIFVEEEQSKNDEVSHTRENVGWVVVGF